MQRRALLCLVATIALSTHAMAAEPFRVHGNTTTFEIAPVLLAADRVFPDDVTVKMGGIFNLYGEPGVPGYSEPGVADVATHAETQGLRYSLRHPDLRIVMTVAEGLYRIVARRSAGIETLADLKGKRIATIEGTSSGYFLHRMLASVGLSEADVEIVRIMPLGDMPRAIADRTVDAVTIWEPEIENAAHAVGDDLVEFSGDGIYREVFNLNTTAANLANPAMRARIKAFMTSVIEASAMINADPAIAQPLVVQASGYDPDLVARAWKHQRYPGDLVPDLLDVLDTEEQWLAKTEKRAPRSRAQLSTLIDDSLMREIRARQ